MAIGFMTSTYLYDLISSLVMYGFDPFRVFFEKLSSS